MCGCVGVSDVWVCGCVPWVCVGVRETAFRCVCVGVSVCHGREGECCVCMHVCASVLCTPLKHTFVCFHPHAGLARWLSVSSPTPVLVWVCRPLPPWS